MTVNNEPNSHSSRKNFAPSYQNEALLWELCLCLVDKNRLRYPVKELKTDFRLILNALVGIFCNFRFSLSRRFVPFIPKGKRPV